MSQKNLDKVRPSHGSRDRRNLTVQLSEDDGATWKVKRVIDAGWAAYADINVAKDGTIVCLYERGEPNADRLRIAALTLVRFSPELAERAKTIDANILRHATSGRYSTD